VSAGSRRRRRTELPTVVFVDHARWAAFAQLAAVVRRAGGRAVRVTTRRPGLQNRVSDRLLFDRSIYLDSPDALATLAELLAGENVVDVQATEYVCGPIARGDAGRLPAPLGPALALRGTLLDKYTVGELATERGVRTPPKLLADHTTVDEAVAAFGLPVVVKARVGASGDLVRIVSTAEEAERALSELDADRGELFFEQLVVGEDVDYSAIVGAGGVVADSATRTLAAPPGSTTPPGTIEVIDAPDLLDFGRHAAEKLGFTGIVHMDTVRDAEGRYWLIDLNLRAWGSMIPAKSVGVDFASAYLYSIGMRTEPLPPDAVRTGTPVIVFPRVVDDKIAGNRAFGAVGAFLRHSWPYLGWLGLRYWLGQLMTVAGQVLTVTKRLLATRTRTAQAGPANP
jgi:hypothetical protein